MENAKFVTLEASSEYRPTFAISDIDGYHILFYTNYIKFNHRAMLNAITSQGLNVLSVDLDKIQVLKYMKPVKWGDTVTIRTTVLSLSKVTEKDDTQRNWDRDRGPGDCIWDITAFHEWVRHADDTTGIPKETCNQAIAQYRCGIGSLSAAVELKLKELEDVKSLRRIEAFRKSNQADFVLPEGGLSPRREKFRMFADMGGREGRLTTSAIFDMVERARTNIVGGQDVLRRMQEDKGLRIYASMLQDCRFNANARNVPLGSDVFVESWTTLTVNNHCGYVKQKVVLEDGTVAFTYLVKLFLFHEPTGKIVPFTGESLISMQTNSGFF